MKELQHHEKADVTRYLIGYAIAQIENFLREKNISITTEETAERITDLLLKAAEFRLAQEQVKYPGIVYYPVEVRRNTTNTKLLMGFKDSDGNWEEAPMSIPLNFSLN